MGIINIIDALAPIIAMLIFISHEDSELKNARPPQKPINMDTSRAKISDATSLKKNLFQKPWFIGLLSLLCMAYVLPEVMSSDELTRMAVYKIVMGTGAFFFILLHSAISGVVEIIFKLKSADLELFKTVLKKPNN